MTDRQPRIWRIVLVVAAVAAACGDRGSSLVSETPSPSYEFLSTKTPYEPQTGPGGYEPAPDGYRPVFTQLLARHGARALTSANDLDYIDQLTALADRAGALSDLGRALPPQVESLRKANETLKYGNLSKLGIEEHQDLAARLLTRLPSLFQDAIASGRRVHVVTSGKDRAVDSGANFAASLKSHLPALAPLVDPLATDEGLLYFFKLNQPYQDWLKNDPTLKAKLGAVLYDEQSHQAARALFQPLLSEAFLDKLAAGALPFKDPKSKVPIARNEVDLAASLYALFQIAPGLAREGTWDFARFVPDEAAARFAYVFDASEFYQKGPSFAGSAITFGMAKILQDDFFTMAKDGCSGNGKYAADLRFAHAETVMPFVALMQIPPSDQQVPASGTFTYDDNPWRGDFVSPYAANIQWDAYRNDAGDCLVHMLYEEKETRFKADCRSIRPDSFFYELSELERCYGE